MTDEQLIHGMEIAAKRGAQYNIEVLNEELLPTLMILTDNNRIELAHIAAERDEISTQLKETLISKQAKAYVLIVEGWASAFVENLKKYDRVRDMPPDDRYEVTNITLVKQNDATTKFMQARIDTQTDGRRTLREWETGTMKASRLHVTDW